MTLEKKTVPHEIVVHFNADGTISQASYTERTLILDDGEVVASSKNPTKPIPLDSPVFKAAEAQALNQVVELTAALKVEQDAHVATKGELTQAKAAHDQLVVAMEAAEK